MKSIVAIVTGLCLQLYFPILVVGQEEPGSYEIAGLSCTGVDSNSVVLPHGALEQHYVMSGPNSPAYVLARYPGWVEPPYGSAWIGPKAYDIYEANNTYTLTFDLTGFDPNTALITGRWSSDNAGEIFLNGLNTGFTNGWLDFDKLLDFTISSGFRQGVNTIEFKVNNCFGSGVPNPSGLLVADLAGQADAVHTDKLSLVAPNGGETLVPSSRSAIVWTSVGTISGVKIELSSDDGLNWEVVEPNTPNDGKWTWLVPDITSRHCLIRISDAADANMSDVSNGTFEIRQCRFPTRTDMNCDCRVDFMDFAIFANDWLFGGEAAEAAFAPGRMILIPGGEFEMGDHYGGRHNAPVHTVRVDSFFIGKYEVTVQEYCGFLNSAYAQGLIDVKNGVVYAFDDTEMNEPYFDTNFSAPYDLDSGMSFSEESFVITDPNRADHPAIFVSWFGAAAYCNWLSSKSGFQDCYDLATWKCDFRKIGFRLPTEAEWEYAARGGQHDPYYEYPWGDNEINGSKANYADSNHPFANWTTPVGYYNGNQIPAGTDMVNGYGLYDVAGNAYEWCNDWQDQLYYYVSPHDNPTGPDVDMGRGRVWRGGAWYYSETECLIAYREQAHQDSMAAYGGFRVVGLPVTRRFCE